MKKFKNILGSIFILIGLLFNESVLSNYFSTYAILGLDRRIPLLLIQTFFIGMGTALIFAKVNFLAFNKLFKYYKMSAITLLNTILIFIFLNVLAYSIFIGRDVFIYRNQIFSFYSEPLEEIYNYLNKEEIRTLLRETWSRPYEYEPYTQFKERPYKGRYVNVSEHGFRLVENQGPWPPDKNNLNIFLFGGSTTFCYGLPDDKTVANYLQKLFTSERKNVFVYNFGRGNYYSTQERILFEKLLSSGFVPDIAVFIDGLNDFLYINDEPQYTIRFREFIKSGGTLLGKLPLVKAMKEMFNAISGRPSYFINKEKYNDPVLIENAIKKYVANKKIIESMAMYFGVKTLFVWQPVPTYKYDLKYHKMANVGFGRFTHSKYGYIRMAEYVKDVSLGKNFLWLADIQEDTEHLLYVDIDHYSDKMSKLLANRIHEHLIRNII